MKIFRVIVNVILAFVLMVGILATSLLCLADSYLGKEYLMSKLDEIDIYTQVYEEVKDGFEDYIYQSGLDVGILDEICTRDKVKQDMTIAINSIYTGEKFTLDTASIKNNLDAKINEFVAGQNRKLSNQEKKNIEKFEDLIVESYSNHFSIYNKIAKEFSTKLESGISIVEFLKGVSIGITVAVLICLCLINIKNISGYGFIGVAFLSGGILLICFKNLITSNISIDNLLLSSKSLSNAIIYIAKEFLEGTKKLGVFYSFVGGLLIVITSALGLDKASKHN